MAEPPKEPQAPRRHRFRRALKWTALLLVGAVIILPLIAYLWLVSPLGGSFLRRQAVERTNAAISGRIEIDHISISEFLRVEIRGVRLFAPGEKRPAASIDRATVHVHLLGLLRKHVEVAELELDSPELRLAQRAETSNLSAAITPRTPSPAKTGAPARLPHLSLSAPSIRIRNGSFQKTGKQPLVVNDINLHAAVSGAIDDDGIAARVDTFELRTAASHLELAGRGRLNGTEADLRIIDGLVGASDLKSFLPALHVSGDVRFAGRAQLRGNRGTGAFQVTLPAGRINLDAQADIARRDYAAVVDIDGVDPNQLARSLPSALLQVRIVAQGVGWPPDERASIDVVASGSRYHHLPIERLTMRARLKGLGAEVEELIVAAAGVHLDVHGTLDAKKAALQLTLNAPSLKETHRQLERGLGQPLPPLAGELKLTAEMEGPYLSPHASVHASAPELVFGTNQVTGLDVQFRLDRLRPIPEGEFFLSAADLLAGGRAGKGFQLKGAIDGHHAMVAGTGAYGANPIRLVVDATRSPRAQGQEHWVLNTLHVQALGFILDSDQRATLAFGHGRESIDGLRLSAGKLGRVSLDGSYDARGPLKARLLVHALHVEGIPGEFLPPDLPISGTVDLRLDARGTTRSPIADAVVLVRHGRYRSLRSVWLQAGGHYERRRIEAAATLRHRGSTIEVTARAPLVRALSSPLEAVVSIDHFRLADIGPLLPSPQALQGVVEGTVRVGGTLRSPSIETELLVDGFSGFGVDEVTAALNETFEHSQLDLNVDVRRRHTAGLTFVGHARIPAASLVEGRPVDWLHLPLEARLDLRRFNLAWLTRFPGTPQDLAGSVAGRISVKGPLAAPQVEGAIEAADVNGAGYRNVKALIDIHAVDDLRLTTEVSIDGHPALQLAASADASPMKLAAMPPERRFAVPFQVDIRLLPTQLARLLPKARYDGRAELALVAQGTPDHPTLHFEAAVSDLHTESGQEAGNVTARIDYEHAATSLNVALHTHGRGNLDVTGSMAGALGASALMGNPEAVLDYPITGFSATAHQLDLALFEGAADMITGLGGTLDVNVTPRDGAFALRQWGRSIDAEIGVTKGQLTIVEFGSFTDIALKASASAETRTLVVSTLSGKSGSGGFSLPKMPDGSDAIHFEVGPAGDRITGSVGIDFRDFPFVQSYQTRAVVSLWIRTLAKDGATAPIVVDLRHRAITIDELLLSHGLVHIPSAIPKGVQSLEPNPDVVIVNRQHAPPSRTPSSPAWTFAIHRIEIPSKTCGGSTTKMDCGPLVVDAPLGNRVELSTNPNKPLEVQVNPKLAASTGSPVALRGVVQLAGTVSLIKSRFDLEHVARGDMSNVDFTGQPVTDPKLDIRAHLETETQRLDVTVTGTLRDPQKKFEANPPFADDNEVYYYLATGQRQTRAQQNDPTTVQTQLVNAGISALGSAAFGYVKDTLLSFLPPAARLDVLEVNPDVTAAGGIGSVRAGKRYLGGNLLITGQYNPNANPLLNQNTYEVRGNYRINRDITLQGLAGTAGHYEFNVIVQKDFCAPRQKREGLCGRKPKPPSGK